MESITNTVLTDMAGAFIEHSAMITNFVAVVYSQLINSVCRVFPDNVQYKWYTKDGGKNSDSRCVDQLSHSFQKGQFLF